MTTTTITKQQAIKALAQFGVTDIVPNGKFQIDYTIGGERGTADPRDLLTELQKYREAEASNEQYQAGYAYACGYYD